jgi:hypothetical protein
MRYNKNYEEGKKLNMEERNQINNFPWRKCRIQNSMWMYKDRGMRHLPF